MSKGSYLRGLHSRAVRKSLQPSKADRLADSAHDSSSNKSVLGRWERWLHSVCLYVNTCFWLARELGWEKWNLGSEWKKAVLRVWRHKRCLPSKGCQPDLVLLLNQRWKGCRKRRHSNLATAAPMRSFCHRLPALLTSPLSLFFCCAIASFFIILLVVFPFASLLLLLLLLLRLPFHLLLLILLLLLLFLLSAWIYKQC